MTDKAFTVRSYLDGKNSHTLLRIERIRLDLAGVYKVKVTNGDKVEEERFKLTVKQKPKVGYNISSIEDLVNWTYFLELIS